MKAGLGFLAVPWVVPLPFGCFSVRSAEALCIAGDRLVLSTLGSPCLVCSARGWPSLQISSHHQNLNLLSL